MACGFRKVCGRSVAHLPSLIQPMLIFACYGAYIRTTRALGLAYGNLQGRHVDLPVWSNRPKNDRLEKSNHADSIHQM